MTHRYDIRIILLQIFPSDTFEYIKVNFVKDTKRFWYSNDTFSHIEYMFMIEWLNEANSDLQINSGKRLIATSLFIILDSQCKNKNI